MKNIIVGIFTLLTIGLMVFTFNQGRAFNGGEQAKVIKDFGDSVTLTYTKDTPKEKDDRAKEAEALNSLKEKAGNIGSFKVSKEYKQKCASCHGANGAGVQNGRTLMGTRLFGQTSDEIYKKLDDYKSGRTENMIMRGLLIRLSKEDLRRFADEIADFPVRQKAMK